MSEWIHFNGNSFAQLGTNVHASSSPVWMGLQDGGWTELELLIRCAFDCSLQVSTDTDQYKSRQSGHLSCGLTGPSLRTGKRPLYVDVNAYVCKYKWPLHSIWVQGHGCSIDLIWLGKWSVRLALLGFAFPCLVVVVTMVYVAEQVKTCSEWEQCHELN